ncbi:sirohydrochlorin chelatase [Marinomonas sp.]
MLHEEYDHIILLAHGSPDPLWKQPFESLYEQAITLYGRQRCSLAFMELTTPTLEEVTFNLPANVNKVGVLPLFLAVGRHLRKDVPLQIQALQSEHLTMTLLPPIGEDEIIKQAMQEVIASHIGKTL